MADVTILKVSSGAITTRPFTAEENEQRKGDEKSEKERQKHEAAQAEARAAAVAHAKSLGFTDEMIAVMYPGLAEPPK